MQNYKYRKISPTSLLHVSGCVSETRFSIHLYKIQNIIMLVMNKNIFTFGNQGEYVTYGLNSPVRTKSYTCDISLQVRNRAYLHHFILTVPQHLGIQINWCHINL
jgi:hypothetical protein